MDKPNSDEFGQSQSNPGGSNEDHGPDEAESNVQDGYSKHYSEKSLFEKIMKFAKKAGIKVVYTVLLLYYTMTKKDVPAWAKTMIIGALGYFILPFDIIPDTIPVAGFTDDYGVLAAALAAVAMHIDDEVKDDARKKLKDWFGNYNEDEINEVDSKMNGKAGTEKE